MALQHFYSRVPAKVSMFNRADGFDTFACSDLLNEETVTANLSCVYNAKPGKDEVSLIREEKIPPVYFHFEGKDGSFIQSCMSFLKLDYTGERTSYLVHSLIMDKQEENTVLYSPDNDILNPDLFVHNLDGFDITSFESTADDKYPTLDYKAKKSSGTAKFVEEYDQDMIKRLIYATLSIACGKGKSVYISLCNDISQCSQKTLEFMNTFMQIFPYHIRTKLPFVTYTSDFQRYPDFKVKGILDSFSDIPTSKGIVLHFNQKISLGLLDELVMGEKFIVDFFYETLCNDQLRREFLCYVQSVYEKMPELSKTTMKNLRELVLLFCQCSGLYNEKLVLPNDDSVHEFVCVYDKYRFALSEEFRANAMVCLKRFPLAHAQIPSKTFSKITKMYPTETVASKKIIMASMLDLIHTDAMRAKLFNFLKANYAEEPDITKHLISENLCRVYYGGFLRPQILEFFGEIFAQEHDENKDMIFEKILLTIRTDAIRTQILEFIDKYYDTLSSEQKNKLFLTFAEVAVDGSQLSEEFALLMNKHIENDENSRQNFSELFCNAIEKEQKRKEHPMLNLICSGRYPYLYGILCQKVFGDWQTRAIFEKFVAAIYKNGISNGINNAVKILSSVEGLSDEAVNRILDLTLAQLETEKSRLKLPQLVGVEDSVLTLGRDFYGTEKIITAIYPLVVNKICDALFIENGLDVLNKYTENHPEIINEDLYIPIKNYYLTEKCLKDKKIDEFFKVAFSYTDNKVLDAVYKLLKKNRTDVSSYDDVEPVFAIESLQIIFSDNFDFLGAYDAIKSDVSAIALSKSDEDDDLTVSKKTIDIMLRVLNCLIGLTPEDKKEEIALKIKYFSSVVNEFKTTNKKNAEKWISDKLKSEYRSFDSDLLSVFSSSDKSSSSSWISKIFKK